MQLPCSLIEANQHWLVVDGMCLSQLREMLRQARGLQLGSVRWRFDL